MPTRRPRQPLRGDDWPGPVLPPGPAPLPEFGRSGLVRRRTALGSSGPGATASTTSPPTSSALKEPNRVSSRRSRLSTSTCFARTIPSPESARVSQGLVVIPTDSASPEQIERYRAYAADRFERTLRPHGPRGMVISPDYVGTSDELADVLHAHSWISARRRGRVRAAVQLRRRRLRPDHHGHGHRIGTQTRVAPRPARC